MGASLSPITSDIDFEKDGKQVSYLRVPFSRNSSAWGSLLIPITVIKNGSGPTIFFNGGMHGDEYEGPVCLSKLSRALEPHAIQGRVIIIPGLNLPALRAGARLSPVDGRDLNRVFPGLHNGTISQIIAHYVHSELLPLCDIVVDLHSGGYSLNFVPYMSMHYLDDQAQSEATFAAMRAFGAPVGLIIREISGEGLLDYEVERMGKIFLCAELGGAGLLSPRALRVAEAGVYRLLRHFRIASGGADDEPAGKAPESRLMEVPGPDYYHTAPDRGIYESLHELGAWVEAGQPVGQLHFVDNFSRAPEPIMARRAGLLIGTRGPGQAEQGDCVAVIARDYTPG